MWVLIPGSLLLNCELKKLIKEDLPGWASMSLPMKWASRLGE